MGVAEMTSHTARLYALAATIAVFFVAWAVIAAHPWQAAAATRKDPRLVKLAVREKHLRHEAVLVRRIVKHRWVVYRKHLMAREKAIAAAKHQAQLVAAQQAAAPVRVVTLAPVTITRSS